MYAQEAERNQETCMNEKEQEKVTSRRWEKKLKELEAQAIKKGRGLNLIAYVGGNLIVP